MKRAFSHFFGVLFAVVLVLSSAGCGGSGGARGWQPVSGKVDSLFDAFNSAWVSQQTGDSLAIIVDALECEARESGMSEALSRAAYCRARWLNGEQRPAEAAVKIQEAIAIQDSARCPYARMKYRYLQAIVDLHLKKDVGRAYGVLEKAASWFARAGDTLSLAEAFNSMGLVLREAGETAEGNSYIGKAQSLYEKTGMRIYALKNRLNLAVACYEQGDTASCRRLLSDLRRDSAARRDARFYNSVLLNSYIYCRDTSALAEAGRQLSGMETQWPLRNTEIEVCKAIMALDMGKIDSADLHSRQALAGIGAVSDTALAETVYEVRAAVHHIAGRSDSAYEALSMKVMLSGSRIAGETSRTVRRERVAAAIASERERSGLRYERQRLRFLIVLMSVCVAAMGGIIFMIRRVGRMRLREARRSMEVDRRSSQLAVASCALREKENLVEEVRGIIAEAKNKGHLAEDTTRRLDTSLRVYADTNGEWDNLRMLYESLPPGFEDALRQRSPGIPDSLVRIAAYIACGLTSKQIARLLKIQPDSVKKSRWRLRTRLGLSQSDSLEDSLGEIKRLLDQNLD